MTGLDWPVVGQTIGAVGMVAGGMWAWWLKNQKAQAVTRAEVAQANAEKVVADANGTVYALLTKRLESLESDVGHLRQELAQERQRCRRMELHIGRLEGLMRKAGIEPPTFDEDELKAGGSD